MRNKICLIIPPSPFLLDERVFMSLGILRVAAVLERAGVAVELLDLSGVDNFQDAVAGHVAATDTACFGLTATTPQLPAVREIVDVLRGLRPQARLILGGPHVTLAHAAYRQEQKRNHSHRAGRALRQLQNLADVLVAGDGELAVFEALGPSPPPLIDGDDPGTSRFLQSAELNRLPFPARHLVDVDSYRYTIDGTRALSLIAQLGCPFGCGFCGGRLSPSLRRVRMRTAENIVQEMLQLYHVYGVRGFMLYDDELNVNPKMLELMRAVTEAQRNLGVDFRLRGFIKAELFTDEQAAAMHQAGFRWILVGFESGHERILTNIHKQATLDDNTRCLSIAKRHGLKVKALMSLGHPGESEATVRATRDWLVETRPDDFDATVITPYPGTPYFDEAVDTAAGIWTYTFPGTGDRLHSYEVDYSRVAEYYKGIPGTYQSYVYTDHLGADALVRLRDWLEADVRTTLGIPYPTAVSALRYEHSMGQGSLPPSILRTSAAGRPDVFAQS